MAETDRTLQLPAIRGPGSCTELGTVVRIVPRIAPATRDAAVRNIVSVVVFVVGRRLPGISQAVNSTGLTPAAEPPGCPGHAPYVYPPNSAASRRR